MLWLISTGNDGRLSGVVDEPMGFVLVNMRSLANRQNESRREDTDLVYFDK